MNCFWGHNFTKWEKINEQYLDGIRRDGSLIENIGLVYIQRRECINCGFVEVDKQELRLGKL